MGHLRTANPRPPVAADLLGVALQDYLDGARTPAHLRRSDGRLVKLDLGAYFAAYAFFPPFERQLLARATGDVLDLGAGAGRAALYLQELALGGREPAGRGDDQVVSSRAPVRAVWAVDISPAACLCMRRRGVAQVLNLNWRDLPADGVSRGGFDTVLLLGSGIGMAGTHAGLEDLLRVIRLLLRPGGCALVTGYAGSASVRAVRMRLEYGRAVGHWFPWLEVPQPVLRDAAIRCRLSPLDGLAAAGPGEDYGELLRAV